MDSWCKGSEERVRWQRRIRSHQSPDANSEPDSNACDANSGAIGITESESVGTKPVGHADSDTIGITKPDTHAEHDTVGDIVDDTGTRAHAKRTNTTAAPTASDWRRRRRGR